MSPRGIMHVLASSCPATSLSLVDTHTGLAVGDPDKVLHFIYVGSHLCFKAPPIYGHCRFCSVLGGY